MTQRTNENKDERTAPLNTTGQTLLSGNIFCGHCGGRLVVTSNSLTRANKDGVKIKCRRICYICYNRSRRRTECDGQLGYTAHILDGMIIEILHKVFECLTAVDESVIIGGAEIRQRAELDAAVKRMKAENTKAYAEYEALKAEVVKAVQGKSKMPVDILSELVEEKRDRVVETSEQLTAIMSEFDEAQENAKTLKADVVQIRSWSEIFDGSDLETKKMIANYMIKRITVYEGYKLDVEMNMNVQQFLNGLEATARQKIAS